MPFFDGHAFFVLQLSELICIVHYNSNVLFDMKGVTVLHDVDGEKPIYIQIADWLENAIIDGTLQADEKVYSQYQLAELFTINPATAGKGLTILLEAELVYKKRGLGMFVAPDAQEKLRAKRKEQTLLKIVQDLLNEASLLDIGTDELDQIIEKERKQRKGNQT